MLTETGKGLPIASALRRKTSIWRPGVKLTLMLSGPCMHMRWMVTSETPVSGSSARRRAMLKKAPVSLVVLMIGGMTSRRSNGGLMTTSWQSAFVAGTVTGGIGRSRASRRSKTSRSLLLPRSRAVRSRLARTPATTLIA